MVKNLKKKSFHKYLLCFLAGMLVVGSISVYAVTTIIDSKEVSYDKKNSSGSYDNVQDSIDELYQRYKDLSGEQDTLYTEEILNGADPVLGDGMIPITLDAKGNVKYANLYTPWYSYKEKKWANAVILVKSPSKQYKTGDTILEKDIESYFVWIPRYKYKIWNLGNYDGYYEISQLKDTADDLTSIRHITGNARLIDIVFENKNTPSSTTQAIGNYYTHPAFIAFDVNGLWVGKFETGYNQMDVTGVSIDSSKWTTTGAENDVVASSRIVVKPDVYSWRSIKVGNIFKNAIDYEPNLKSHMMKNTEWGAAAYLSHSIYGIGSEINTNNNENYKTGYSAAANTDQSTFPGEYGNATSNLTKLYNTTTGYLASTTGNITGVYDMRGGCYEYVAGYIDGYGLMNSEGVASGLTASDLSKEQYFDKYDSASDWFTFSKRILGDATGEMGPFYIYVDKDNVQKLHNAWYGDHSTFIIPLNPFFYRGGGWDAGILSGQFYFNSSTFGASPGIGSRLVLAVG